MELQPAQTHQLMPKEQAESHESQLTNCFKKFRFKQKFFKEALQLGLQQKYQEIAQRYILPKQKAAFLVQINKISKPSKLSTIIKLKKKQQIKKVLQQFQVEQEKLEQYIERILNLKISEVMEQCITPVEAQDFIERLRKIIEIPEDAVKPTEIQKKQAQIMKKGTQHYQDKAPETMEELIQVTKEKLQSLQFLSVSVKAQILFHFFEAEEVKDLLKKLRINDGYEEQIFKLQTYWRQRKLTTFERIDLIQIYMKQMAEEDKKDLEKLFDLLKQGMLQKISCEGRQQIKRKLKCQKCPSKKQLIAIINKTQTQYNSAQKKNNLNIQNINQCLNIFVKIQNFLHKKGKKRLQNLLQDNLKTLINLNVSQQELKSAYVNACLNLKKNILENSYGTYLTQKLQTLKIKYLMDFYNINDQQINTKYFRLQRISNGDTFFFQKISDSKIFQTALAKKIEGITRKSCILTVLNQGIENVITLDQTLNEIFEIKKLEIKLYEGRSFKIIIGEQSFDIVLAVQTSLHIVKQLISTILQQKNLYLKINDIDLEVKFAEKNCKLQSSILQLEERQKRKVEKIKVQITAKVEINQDQKTEKYNCSYFDTIGALKVKISQNKKIPIAGIKLQITVAQQQYIRNENQQQQMIQSENIKRAPKQLRDEQKLCEINPNDIHFGFTLKIESGMLHFGFRNPQELKLEQFNSFFIETSQDEQNRFQSFSFDQSEDSFLHQVLPYLYFAVKKRFNCEDVIANIKRIIYEKTNLHIWETDGGNKGTFNNNFLHTFLLSNSQPKLRIVLMNLLKSNYPIPIYFRQFKDIYSISENYVLNQQLVWILNPSLTICSMGFHTEKGQCNKIIQSGKSFLLNKLFFTSFVETKNKHQLTQRTPEIYLNAYSKFYDINIIDIPRKTSFEQINKILQNSNILILQSWQKHDDTQEKIQQLIKNYPHLFIITLLRDSKKSIQNATEKMKELKIYNFNSIEVPNLSEIEQKHSFYTLLRKIINNVLINQYKKESNQQHSLSNLSHNKIYSQFEEKTKILKQKMFDLKTIYPKIQKLRLLQKNLNKKDSQQQEIQKITNQIKKAGLPKNMHEIFDFIANNPQNYDLLLSRLRQKLKLFKNNAEKPYNQIYEFKKQIESLDQENPDFQQSIISYQTKINQIKSLNVQLKGKTKSQIISVLSDVANQIQGSIKPEIFSMELVWRQLIYLSQKSPEYKIGNKNLEDFLVDIKKKDIQGCQPFEIIDGDTLHMPKKLMKDVFHRKDKKIVVISVLGPQSSGKSTLFNFLFGCDFATSQGRCTRGVYGTYFELKKQKSFDCDGIFLIDTEGLFSILNKKDQKVRRDFDSKLVLFCLAISDIAIINTKGNIDNQTEKKLRVAMDKFENLKQQNIKPPQFFLVLNQNNSSSTQSSNADINKLYDIFNQKNCYQLPQAYEIKQIDSDQIHILKKNQLIIKRNSKPDFMKQCNKMLEALIGTIRKKQQEFKSLEIVIDDMQRLWATIQDFPDLASGDSKKIRQLQLAIASFKIDILQNKIDKRVNDIFENYTKSIRNLNDTKEDFQKQQQNIINLYNKSFASDERNQEEKAKLASQKRKLELTLETKLKQLQMKIKRYEAMIIVKKLKYQGSNDQYEAIKQVRNQQQRLKRQLKDEEKRQYFERYYKKSYDRTTKNINQQISIRQSFQYIKDLYKNAMNFKSTDNQFGLVSSQFNLDLEAELVQYKDKLIQNIQSKFSSSASCLQFTKKIPTNVLSGGKSDATLKYFKMDKYFKKSKQNKGLFIDKQNLQNALLKNKLYTQVSQYFYRIDCQEMYQFLNQKVLRQINSVFKAYGFQITGNFTNLFDQKNRYNNKRKCFVRVKQLESNCWENFPNHQKKRFNTSNQFLNLQGLNNFMNTFNKQMKQRNSNNFRVNTNNRNKNSQKRYKKTSQNTVQKSFCYKIQHVLSRSEDIIKWNKIIKLVESKPFYQQYYNKANQMARRALKQDLDYLGIDQYCNNILKYLQEQKNKNIQTKDKQNQIMFFEAQIHKKYGSKVQCINQLKKLRLFSSNQIIESIKQKKVQIEKMHKENLICIGQFPQQIFEVKQQMQFLEKYLDRDTSKVINTLKNEKIRDFLFEQLNSNEKIKFLFNQIYYIVQNCGSELNKKQVDSLFMQVDRQISIFTNDVQQVSYKPTVRFNGYCHIFAIYLYWKKCSLAAKKKALQPLQQLEKSKPKLLQNFLKMTSKVNQKINEVQVDQFIEATVQFIKTLILESKKRVINSQKNYYKQKVNRAYIQQKIQANAFGRQIQKNVIMNYLIKPEQEIQSAYQAQIKHYLKNIEASFKKPDQSQKLYDELMNAIQILFSKIQQVNLTRDLGYFNSFLSIQIKQEENQQSEFSNYCSIVLFKYFAGLISQKKQTIYQYGSIKAKVIFQKFEFSRVSEVTCQQLMDSLQSHNLKITNLYLFLEQLINKMPQLKQNIFKMKYISKDDQKLFRELVSVKICRQKCPCCKRICGQQNLHEYHRCLYGHQIRALGGVKGKNGDASVIRCEDLEPHSKIQFNGNLITWMDFKKYWAQKITDKWKFDDMDYKQSKRQLFNKAWYITGPQFCRLKGMNYLQPNYQNVKAQKQAPKQKQLVHFIFAIDSSDTMGGTKWQDTIKHLNQAIDLMKKIDQEGFFKVSLMTFSEHYKIQEQFIKPVYVNTNLIHNGGKSIAQRPFMGAIYLIRKYKSKVDKSYFIYVSDGKTQYPYKQVGQINGMSRMHKIIFSGIQIGGTESKVMKLLTRDLNGRKQFNVSMSELGSAFIQIIQSENQS